MAPPLRQYCTEDQELRFIEECKNIFHRDIEIVNIPGDQAKKIANSGNRERVLDDMLVRKDGTHMKVDVFTQYYSYEGIWVEHGDRRETSYLQIRRR